MKISEALIYLGLAASAGNTPLNIRNSWDDTQPHSIILQNNNRHTVSTVLIPEEGVIHLNLATSASNTLLDLHNSSHETQPHSIIATYYSFKIFLSFWLAKDTHIIHHDQLLLTKFGRILRLINQWRQKCSTVLLQVNAPLTKKTWGQGWVVLVVKRKMAEQSAEHFTRFTTNSCLKT